MLSSDPESFPIEAGIAPLVFEMKRSGLFEPCWSCEGHADACGGVQKAPTVWFYCRSLTHLRLLASGLANLHLNGSLFSPWRIIVVFSDPDNPAPTFALEPASSLTVSLERLQYDTREIGRNLSAMMQAEATSLHRAK